MKEQVVTSRGARRSATQQKGFVQRPARRGGALAARSITFSPRALFAYVPISQVLLGSDYPFGTSADGIRGLEAYGLKSDDLEAIYCGNAEHLLTQFKI